MKDENDRYKDGSFSHDPESDAEEMPKPEGEKPPFQKLLDKIQPIPEAWLDENNIPPARPQLLTRSGRDFLPLGKTGLACGPGGGSKTQALLQLALAVSSGTQWLGTFDVVEAGRVALLLAEEDDIEIRRRLWTALNELGLFCREKERRKEIAQNLWAVGLMGHDVSLVAREDRLEHIADGEQTAWAKAFIDHLKRAGSWRLIIVDPLSRWAGPGVEKDNYIATRFVEICEELTQLPGNPTVLVAHHISQEDRKAAKRNSESKIVTPRGVTGLSDGARWVASLLPKDNDTVTFSVTKNNYGRCGDPIVLRKSTNGFLVLEPDPDGFSNNAGEDSSRGGL